MYFVVKVNSFFPEKGHAYYGYNSTDTLPQTQFQEIFHHPVNADVDGFWVANVLIGVDWFIGLAFLFPRMSCTLLCVPGVEISRTSGRGLPTTTVLSNRRKDFEI